MTLTINMETEASHMLEAALEQMDDIIAGSKAAALDLTNGVCDRGSANSSNPLQVIQLATDLKLALELQPNQDDREHLRAQLPTETAEALKDWLQSGDVNLCPPANNETYQERLLRLEGDKESLVLQVGVLTDQVEAQGEKIRDLESSLEEHRRKLASTEEMLQQELVSRTSLETQKLDLLDEVSCLKLKLVSIEETHNTHRQESMDTNQNKAECVVNLISELQEQMCRFQEEISTRIQEKQALEDHGSQVGEPRAERVQGHGSLVRLGGTNMSLCGPRTWTHNGGLTANDLLEEVKQLKNKVEELEGEKGQYERQLQVTKLSISYSLHVCYQSLMTQLSSLKLTVGHTQLEKQQWEERWRSAQAEISDLQQLLASKDAEIECLQTQLLARGSTANDNAERDQEYQRLKVGMESLLASNDEKTRRIEELTTLLGQYRKINELMSLTHASSEEELSGSLKGRRAITHKAHCDIYRSEIPSRGSSPLMLSSSPYQRELDSCFQNSMDVSLSAGDPSFFNGSWHQRRLQSSSLEELQSRSLQKCVEILPDESESDIGGENPHMELNKYQTLPGKLSRRGELRSKLNGDREGEEYLSPVRLSPLLSHDQDYSQIRFRSASAPVLGSPGKYDIYYTESSEHLEECILSDQSPLSSGMDSGQHSPMSPENRKTQRGLKKLWGLIRRSQSGSPVQVHDPELGDFKRGGTRATAGPRLVRSGNIRDLKLAFSKWSTEQVCEWLEDIGLGQYTILAHQWVTSGQTLLTASPQDLEKEMGMKNPLHRKKLHLAIKTFNSKRHEKSAELDYLWVTRWLDDIGLPQYKDQFNEGRVDGQMLQYLTVNDLLVLKVTSQLHHLSIKCAIHVLHVNKFNPYCLKRRPGTENHFAPSEVIQWSNHRVMEWLRSVDLAEYAPNLRGSGVHGGLIMLEPRFNSDSLAMLLNIPPQKTLLRRHLTTNFSNLVGAQAQQEKREYTEAGSHTPLSITAKVKPKKLGFSNLTHLRRRRPDESTDYVCPMESAGALEGHSTVNGAQIHHYHNNNFRGLSPILDREAHHSSHEPSIPQRAFPPPSCVPQPSLSV
ncbi:liprin-beta-2b isoform X2 [Corythoichthys intestinalis]|uniref:liprin-beta-2b isoform X2 n=1 Tax=Corythoichthys intestinalis TaxID=161448 RepID=UPI0025A5FFC9|nr:liprin-beta-2b isoform X2 [Corythoichthys intestinalis]